MHTLVPEDLPGLPIYARHSTPHSTGPIPILEVYHREPCGLSLIVIVIINHRKRLAVIDFQYWNRPR